MAAIDETNATGSELDASTGPDTISPKLGYVILYVEELDAAMKFYSEVLGFQEQRRVGSYGELRTGVTVLALSERKFMCEEILGELPAPGGGCSEIGVVVPRNQVHLLFERALHGGATCVKAPVEKPWGQLVSYVRDPDGHLLEICSPVD